MSITWPLTPSVMFTRSVGEHLVMFTYKFGDRTRGSRLKNIGNDFQWTYSTKLRNVIDWWTHHNLLTKLVYFIMKMCDVCKSPIGCQDSSKRNASECSQLIFWRSKRHSKQVLVFHDNVIKWEEFPRYWSFVWGIHRSPVNSPHKDKLRGALIVFFICVLTNGWVNNRDTGDWRRHRAHYDVIVIMHGMVSKIWVVLVVRN